MKAGASNGLNLEVVFYPKPGRNHHELRAEFTVAIFDAASHIGVHLVPSQLNNHFPTGVFEQEGSNGTESVTKGDHEHSDNHDWLDDLLPSGNGDTLQKRAGFQTASD